MSFQDHLVCGHLKRVAFSYSPFCVQKKKYETLESVHESLNHILQAEPFRYLTISLICFKYMAPRSMYRIYAQTWSKGVHVPYSTLYPRDVLRTILEHRMSSGYFKNILWRLEQYEVCIYTIHRMRFIWHYNCFETFDDQSKESILIFYQSKNASKHL